MNGMSKKKKKKTLGENTYTDAQITKKRKGTEGQTKELRMCVLHSKPFFLPVDIHVYDTYTRTRKSRTKKEREKTRRKLDRRREIKKIKKREKNGEIGKTGTGGSTRVPAHIGVSNIGGIAHVIIPHSPHSVPGTVGVPFTLNLTLCFYPPTCPSTSLRRVPIIRSSF